MVFTASGAVQIGQLKQFRPQLMVYACESVCRRSGVAGAYRLPSLRTILLGVSNRQFGQYQLTISSVIHRGHLIWWQSSQYRSCSGGKREKLERGDLGSKVCSASSSWSSSPFDSFFSSLVASVCSGVGDFCGEPLDLRFLAGSGTGVSAQGHEM